MITHPCPSFFDRDWFREKIVIEFIQYSFEKTLSIDENIKLIAVHVVSLSMIKIARVPFKG